MDTKFDAHVQSPFYMDLGIKGFRNCELFKDITIMSILKNGKFRTFYETIKLLIQRRERKMRHCNWKRITFFITIAFVIFTLCMGCTSQEEKKAKHLDRAKQFIEEKEFKKAVIELRNVIQLDPGK